MTLKRSIATLLALILLISAIPATGEDAHTSQLTKEALDEIEWEDLTEDEDSDEDRLDTNLEVDADDMVFDGFFTEEPAAISIDLSEATVSETEHAPEEDSAIFDGQQDSDEQPLADETPIEDLSLEVVPGDAYGEDDDAQAYNIEEPETMDDKTKADEIGELETVGDETQEKPSEPEEDSGKDAETYAEEPEKPDASDASEGEVESSAEVSIAESATADEGVAIDADHFPDDVFRGVIGGYDLDNDGILNIVEIESIIKLDLGHMGINQLEGISYFTNLRKLDCSWNQLHSLDISALTLLETLDCSYNQLVGLDASDLTHLESLDCNGNGYDFKYLYLNGCTALRYLDCEDNNFYEEVLDVSNCINLENLSCSWNNLLSLNVENCTSLKSLACYGNSLNSLDVSNCRQLEYLGCSDNWMQELTLGNQSHLTYLYCRWNRLTSLDLSGCPSLVYLECAYNLLTTLDVASNSQLYEMDCEGNQLTTLSLDTPSLRKLNCPENRLTSLYIDKCKALKWLDCRDNQLATLDVSNCKNLVKAVLNPWRYEDDGTYIEYVSNEIDELIFDKGVRLIPEKVIGISLNRTKATGYVGKTFSLTATLKPKNVGTKLTWKSSDKSVATVSGSGVISPLKKGKTTITVTTSDGKKATCVITVKANKIDNLTKNPSPAQIKAIKGKWTLQPKSLEFLSNGNLVVEMYVLNGTSKTSSYLKDVVLKIKLSGKNLARHSFSKVTVKAKKNSYATVKMTIPKDSVQMDLFQLTKYAASKYAFFAEKSLVMYPGKVAYKPVQVKYFQPYVEEIRLNSNEVILEKDDVTYLKATVLPDYASDRGITWTSSDESVVSVDASGVLYAIAEGEAVITAAAKDGSGVSATCAVEVIYSEEFHLDIVDEGYELLEISDVQDEISDVQEYETQMSIEALNEAIEDVDNSTVAYNDSICELMNAYSEYAYAVSYVTLESGDIISLEDFLLTDDFFDLLEYSDTLKNKKSEAKAGKPRSAQVSDETANRLLKNFDAIDIWAKSMKAKYDGLSFRLNASLTLILERIAKNEKVQKQAAKTKSDAIISQNNARKAASSLDPNVRIAALRKIRAYEGTIAQANETLEKVKDVLKNDRLRAKNLKADITKSAGGAGVALDLLATLNADRTMVNDLIQYEWHHHPTIDDKPRAEYVENLKDAIKVAKLQLATEIAIPVASCVAVAMLLCKSKIAMEAAAGGGFAANFGGAAGKFSWLIEWAGNSIGSSALHQNGTKHYKYAVKMENILHGKVRGKITGKVIDKDTGKPIKDVRVYCDDVAVLTDANGKYTLKPRYGAYYDENGVKFIKKGYENGELAAYVDETNGSLVKLPTLKMKAKPTIVTGTVYDASVRGKTLSGVKVTYGSYATKTNANGVYTFKLKPEKAGKAKISFKKDDYISPSPHTLTSKAHETVTYNCYMSEEMAKDTYKVVLTWGSNPRDLDSHLTSSSGLHVFYGHKVEGNASLDRDDRYGNGCETLTFTPKKSGTFTYYVHDFTNKNNSSSTAMGNSGAIVTVYRGTKFLGQYRVPKRSGTIWNVFRVVNGQYTPY